VSQLGFFIRPHLANDTLNAQLANKGDEDEQRVVTSDEGVDLAARWNESVFFEVSARTRMSLDEALKEVIHEIKSQQEAFIDVPWFSAVPKWSFEE